MLDTSGKRVDKGDTAASDEANGLRVSLSDIGEGGYAVAWTSLSAVDGHSTKGSFSFAVGNAPLPPVIDVGEAAPPPRALEVFGRSVSFLGLALLIGISSFGLFVRRTPTEPEDRREHLLLAFGGVAIVLGSVALLLDQGGRSPPRLTTLLTIRGLAGVAVLAAAAAVAERRVRAVALAAGLIGVVTATAVSHAAASGEAPQMLLDLAHALAAALWAGGVATFAIVTLPAIGRDLDFELGGLVWRFSVFAIGATSLIALTGLIQALGRLVLIEDLWETPYGIALLAKIVLFAIAIALASTNLLRWGPRLRRGVDPAGSRRAFALSVRGELVPIALILTVTGVLTALVPTAQASGAAYDSTRHAEGLRLELLVASTSPGQNRFVLRVHEGLAPVTDAVKVAFRFTMVEHDMGENELVATQRAAGEYVATGSVTAMFGTWHVESIVRLPGRADVRSVFTVPIGAPTGPGAVARAISAPPYQLVVYVDPPQPVAGAPLTLNVVVVDEKGDPVSGKAVTVAFSGPAPVRVAGKEISPGRFEAAVPALDAGKWTAAITVDTATGVYEFEVVK